jgi:hypothetical protein
MGIMWSRSVYLLTSFNQVFVVHDSFLDRKHMLIVNGVFCVSIKLE